LIEPFEEIAALCPARPQMTVSLTANAGDANPFHSRLR
jgi:hypothetical protein